MDQDYRQYLEAGQRAGARFSLGTPRKVLQGLAGARMSNRPGSSLEFMDHREYQPGDDLRLIDWSAYARSDKLAVKLYREEVNPHVDLIIDGSRSMALRGSLKVEALLGLAGLLAEAAVNAGFTHRGWLAGEVCQEIPNSGNRPSMWDGFGFGYKGNPGDSFLSRQGRWRERGLRIFLSDLLWLGDPRLCLTHLAEKASSVVVVQLLGRAEIEPEKRGNLRLVDSETGEILELFLDAGSRQRYQERLLGHQQNWHRACREIGATMVTISAEEVLADWDLKELLRYEVLKVNYRSFS